MGAARLGSRLSVLSLYVVGRSVCTSELKYDWNASYAVIFEAKMAEIEARFVGMIQAPSYLTLRGHGKIHQNQCEK